MPLGRVRETIASREYAFGGESLRVTATIGAVIDVGTSGLQTSARRVEEALYWGKRVGRNRVVFAAGSGGSVEDFRQGEHEGGGNRDSGHNHP